LKIIFIERYILSNTQKKKLYYVGKEHGEERENLKD